MPEPENVDTTAITAGRGSIGRSLAPVLYPSTTYTVDEVAEHAAMVGDRGTTGFYSRFASPGVRDFEDAVAALEGAEAAIASSSGMGSVSAVILGLCSQGDHVVATRQLFSVTYALFTFHLPRLGIEVTFVDGTDAGAIADAVIPGRTQVVFVETPANPALALVDLDAIGAIAGPITVVDSTFAGPGRAAPARPRRRPGAPRRHQGHRRPQRQPARRRGRQRRPHRADLGVPVRARHAGVTVRRVERRARHPHAGRAVPAPVGVRPRHRPGARGAPADPLGVLPVPREPPAARPGQAADARAAAPSSPSRSTAPPTTRSR